MMSAENLVCIEVPNTGLLANAALNEIDNSLLQQVRATPTGASRRMVAGSTELRWRSAGRWVFGET